MLHQSEVGEHREGSGVNAGSEMTNIEPTPGSLVQVMSPPCATKIVRAIESPSPEPPISRDRALSTRKNRSNTRGTASAGMPMPVSTTSMRAVAPDCARGNRHAAAGLVVENRVGDDVVQRLTQLLGIAVHRERIAADTDRRTPRACAIGASHATTSSMSVRIATGAGSRTSGATSARTSASSRSTMSCMRSAARRPTVSASLYCCVRALAIERPLRFGAQHRDGRAKLVRRIGDEPALLLDGQPQPIERVVQRRRHLLELALGMLDRDARVQIALRHRARGLADALDRRQRPARDEPAAENRDDQRRDAGERDVQEQPPLRASQVGDVAADEHCRAAGGLERLFAASVRGVARTAPTCRSGSD